MPVRTFLLRLKKKRCIPFPKGGKTSREVILGGSTVCLVEVFLCVGTKLKDGPCKDLGALFGRTPLS